MAADYSSGVFCLWRQFRAPPQPSADFEIAGISGIIDPCMIHFKLF
jgi:hypothetical protein